MNPLQETLDAVKQALQSPSASNDELRKAFNVASGLVNYDLQPGALKLYPFMESLTPLRNRIPRKSGRGDTATRWKAITGINVNNVKMGVSEGNRGGVIATSVVSYNQSYVGLGLEDYVTFEGEYAAGDYEDLKADATLGLLQSFMLGEERMILGGNGSLALGTTPTPTLAAGSDSSGSMATQAAASVICVALTHDGWWNTGKGSIANGIFQTIVKSNIDGSSDTLQGGTAIKSANATVSVSGATGFITAVVAPVKGAVAYAWYVGTVAGGERLAAITTTPTVRVNAYPTTTQQASTLDGLDHSADSAYQFDGLLTQMYRGTGYYKNLTVATPGTDPKLTSDGAGGVNEINDALQYMYDSFRLGPQRFLVNSQEARSLTKLIVGNGGAPLLRATMDAKGQMSGLSGGTIVDSYLNPITGQMIKIEIHPEAPTGTLLMLSDSIPYKLNGVGNVYQIKTRKEYYLNEWPVTKRRWEYGVYADEELQHFAPFSMAVISGIGKA